MKFVTYKDTMGRLFKVSLPDDAPDSDAMFGIVVGPPELDALGLPPDIEVRLNNQLFTRGIFTPLDAKRRREDITNALIAALKVDTNRLIELYLGGS